MTDVANRVFQIADRNPGAERGGSERVGDAGGRIEQMQIAGVVPGIRRLAVNSVLPLALVLIRQLVPVGMNAAGVRNAGFGRLAVLPFDPGGYDTDRDELDVRHSGGFVHEILDTAIA